MEPCYILLASFMWSRGDQLVREEIYIVFVKHTKWNVSFITFTHFDCCMSESIELYISRQGFQISIWSTWHVFAILYFCLKPNLEFGSRIWRWLPSPHQPLTSRYNCVGRRFLFPMEYVDIHVIVGISFVCHFIIFVDLVSTWKCDHIVYYISVYRINNKCQGKCNKVTIKVWSLLNGTFSNTSIDWT